MTSRVSPIPPPPLTEISMSLTEPDLDVPIRNRGVKQPVLEEPPLQIRSFFRVSLLVVCSLGLGLSCAPTPPGENADAGASPEASDSGTPSPDDDDGGPSPDDAGAPSPEDGGPPAPEDGGTPAPEDGGTPEDAGTPVADSGTPSPDAGIPTDAGTEQDAGEQDAGAPADAGSPPEVDAGPVVAPTYAECVAAFTDPNVVTADYDQFGPVIDPSCSGTAHQDITGIERVVFLGDSVSVGTPPTQTADYYRARMADSLAETFGIEAPSSSWKLANVFTGTSTIRDSGAFSSCAEWGARNDDLMQPQVADCLPASEEDKRTLVVFTMGGNDLANLARRGTDPNVTEEDLWLQADGYLQELEDTLTHLYEPGRFPNGIFVVFANVYEYTDGTADLLSCPAASTAGFDANWTDLDLLNAIIVFTNEQYMRLAVEFQADVMFMNEAFCGYGFRRDDVTGRCYRGPNTEAYFDLTCIHPTPRGHQEISTLFLDIIE